MNCAKRLHISRPALHVRPPLPLRAHKDALFAPGKKPNGGAYRAAKREGWEKVGEGHHKKRKARKEKNAKHIGAQRACVAAGCKGRA